MLSRTEEDFELELRSLPGVVNVGMARLDNGDVDRVSLVVQGVNPDEAEQVALQIASLYFPEAKVNVESADEASSIGGAAPSRVALVHAAFNPDDGFCEVQLKYAGRTGRGRSGSGPLIGGAEATLAALRDLGNEIPFSLMSVTNVTVVRNWPVIVTLRSNNNEADRFGIAHADEDVVSAARATLDALNRMPLTRHSEDADTVP
jgi:hypothetical protein